MKHAVSVIFDSASLKFLEAPIGNRLRSDTKKERNKPGARFAHRSIPLCPAHTEPVNIKKRQQGIDTLLTLHYNNDYLSVIPMRATN
jgi:hypothetical protein